jgi:hypothetical protein
VSLPDWIRNWLVEDTHFRSHPKVLLQLALSQRYYKNFCWD